VLLKRISNITKKALERAEKLLHQLGLF